MSMLFLWCPMYYLCKSSRKEPLYFVLWIAAVLTGLPLCGHMYIIPIKDTKLRIIGGRTRIPSVDIFVSKFLMLALSFDSYYMVGLSAFSRSSLYFARAVGPQSWYRFLCAVSVDFWSRLNLEDIRNVCIVWRVIFLRANWVGVCARTAFRTVKPIRSWGYFLAVISC